MVKLRVHLKKTRVSRFLESLFLFPAVISLQTEKMRSTYASEAGAEIRSLAKAAIRGYTVSEAVQKLNPV